MLCRWALIFFSGGVLDICLPALPPGQQEKQTLHPDLPHPRQNAAGLCAQQFTLATVSDSLVAHPHQNAAGLCAQQFTLATVSDSLVAHPHQNAAGLCAQQFTLATVSVL